MKILAIRLRNIASLAGPHEILFDSGPLARAGLFAITGPTGAGKTAILDALCLALYNDTPRLRAVPGKEAQTPDVDGEMIATSDPRTLLRRGAGEGWAEVDFVGQDGLQYRSRWSARRARGRPDGRLQAVEMELRNLSQQQLIAHQIKEHRTQVERALGLSFAQFTRAVLLAQAEFATFLKAADRERAELLEKLTDSARYSRIGIRAWQRRSAAKAALDAVQLETHGLQPLDTEARSALEQSIADDEALLRTQMATQEELRGADAWLSQHGLLQRACALQQTQWLQAQQMIEDHAADDAELTLHASIAPMRERCRRRQRLRLQHDQESAQLRDELATLEMTAQAVDQARAERALAHQTLADAGQRELQARPAQQMAQAAETRRDALQTQRAVLDAELRALRTGISASEQRLQQQAAQLQQIDHQVAALQQKLGAQQALIDIRHVQAALQTQFALDSRLRAEGADSARSLDAAEQAHAAAVQRLDQALAAQSAADAALQQTTAALAALPDPQAERVAAQTCEQQLIQEQARLQAQHGAWLAWQHAGVVLARAQQTHSQGEAGLIAATGAQPALETALAESRQRLDDTRRLIERQRLARKVEIAALRADLRRGEPCPVCGSPEHPFIAHDALLAALQRHDEQELTLAEQAWQAADLAAGTGRQRLAALQAEQTLHQRALEQAQSAVALAAEQAQALGIDGDSADTLPQRLAALAADLAASRATLADLEQRQQQRTRLLQAGQGAELDARTAAQTFSHAQLEHAATAAALQRQRLQHEHLRQQWAQHRVHLQALLPDDWATRALADPAATQAELSRQLRALEDSESALLALQHQREALQQTMDSLQRERAERSAVEAHAAQQLESQDSALATLSAELSACLGDWPDSASWDRSLLTDLQQARAVAEHADQTLAARTEQLAALRVANSERHARLQAISAECAALEAELAVWSAAHPHIDAATRDRLAAVTDEELSRALQAQAARLQALRDARIVLDERRERLAQHALTRPRAADPATLPAALDAVALALAQTRARLDALRADRLQDDQIRARLDAVGERLNAARAEYARWAAIADLIGSTDGAAFRELAQAWHLDQLIAYANHHLHEFARRYRLRRGGSELGLLVIDTEMGDEQRSVHSLSGGESFLVALALALGLASLSSRQLRIESLFIDEGFGSLDPRSLDLALDALDGLQSLGRRVGVISHVQEMHERISTQIRVRRLGQGLSTIEVSGSREELPVSPNLSLL